MHASRKDLLAALESISGTPLLVVGDLMLDRYIWGNCSRISAEAPVPVVKVVRYEDRLGGAGNTVLNLCRLGAQVSVCGLVGDDDEGDVVCALLEEEGVDTSGIRRESERPTTLKTRVIAQRQQIVRVDKEETGQLSEKSRVELTSTVEDRLSAVAGIVIPDYGKGVISRELMEMFDQQQKDGVVSLQSKPLVVDPHPESYSLYRSMTLATPNTSEAEMALNTRIRSRADGEKACRALMEQWNAEMMMITLGHDGMVIVPGQKDKTLVLDTLAREVFDVSGAGDTVAAVFTAAISAGNSPVVAGDLANVAAGVVVSEVGTVPVNPDRLRKEIERLTS